MLPWAFWTEREVVELLFAQGRWADAGAALRDPSRWVLREHASLRVMESKLPPENFAHVLPHFVEKW